MTIKNSIAIVTGASGGIGAALSCVLTQKGAKVVLAARSEQKLLALSRDLPGSFVVVADMTKPDDIRTLVRKTVRRFGRIDILINNAGRGYDAPVEYIDIRRFYELFDLDVVGPLIAMQEVIPIMKARKSGHIVNLSSGTALMTLPDMAAYSSLKQAIAGISLTAREELAPFGIRVSVAYPYVTDTSFEKNTWKDHIKNEWDGESDLPHPPDSADYIAGKIIAGIEINEAQIYAHDWLKKL